MIYIVLYPSLRLPSPTLVVRPRYRIRAVVKTDEIHEREKKKNIRKRVVS